MRANSSRASGMAEVRFYFPMQLLKREYGCRTQNNDHTRLFIGLFIAWYY